MQQTDYDKTEEAHKLFYTRHDGVLSTISIHPGIEGYPFGSVTPFCLDRKGRLVILISSLAQHYKNISENPKVSMMIQAAVDRNSDVQAHGRLTFIGKAEPVPQDELDEVRHRYVRYLPASKRYFEAHDFNFYRVNLTKGRFIGGFGKIFWLEPEELLFDNPFDEEVETGILQHMNEDHQKAMKKYLQDQHGLETGEDNLLQMVGIDAKGCDIRRDGFIYRVWFDQQVSNSTEAREVLTQLARK